MPYLKICSFSYHYNFFFTAFSFIKFCRVHHKNRKKTKYKPWDSNIGVPSFSLVPSLCLVLGVPKSVHLNKYVWFKHQLNPAEYHNKNNK